MLRIVQVTMTAVLMLNAAGAGASNYNPYFQRGYDEAVEREERVKAQAAQLLRDSQAYLDQMTPDEQRQARIRMKDSLAKACIRDYEESQPKRYSTRCYGGAYPDGSSVNGYSNCETEEESNGASRIVVEGCYNNAREALGLNF